MLDSYYNRFQLTKKKKSLAVSSSEDNKVVALEEAKAKPKRPTLTPQPIRARGRFPPAKQKKSEGFILPTIHKIHQQIRNGRAS